MTFTLGKKDRLKSQKSIAILFEQGLSYRKYPIRIIGRSFREQKESSSIRCAFSAPKRIFKKAVDRNLVRRRMKEAYRLQRNLLQEMIQDKDISLHLMMIYTGKEILPYETIEKATKVVLKRFCIEYSTKS